MKRPEPLSLDHVAIAVPALAEGLALYRDGLGLDHLSTEAVPAQGVTVAKLAAGKATLELLEPLTPGEGPIGRFLARHGPGIHHLCFEVADVRRVAAHLAAHGYEPITKEPQPGADGALVLFLRPKTTLGTLIELAERAARTAPDVPS